MNYRAIPRIANSDLTEFKNLRLFGTGPRLQGTPAQAFGTRFHDLLLVDTTQVPTGVGAAATRRMLDVARSNALFNRLLAGGLPESPGFWDDELTGLPCKAKTDLRLPTEGIIVDIKTTSASNQADFDQHCQLYDYDRQAAFYLDGHQLAGGWAEVFIIIGIQKQKPHNLYMIETRTDSRFVEYGRKKYRALLRSWQQQPYRPSSWDRLPAEESSSSQPPLSLS